MVAYSRIRRGWEPEQAVTITDPKVGIARNASSKFKPVNIETVRCEGTDRFGNKMTFARYYLRDSMPDSSENLL